MAAACFVRAADEKRGEVHRDGCVSELWGGNGEQEGGGWRSAGENDLEWPKNLLKESLRDV